MDFSQIDPADRQVMVANLLRKRASSDAMSQANANSNRFGNVAAMAQLMNNPELAAAAEMMHKNALSQGKPVQMGNQGFALPESGDFVESPMYFEEKEATRAATRDNQRVRLQAAVDAQRERDERTSERDREKTEAAAIRQREALDSRSALAQTLAAMRAGTASDANQTRLLMAGLRQSDRAEKDAEKAAAKKEKDLDTQIQKLAQFADKKQLPRLMSQARQLLGQLDKHGDKMPGLGTLEQMSARTPFGDRMLSPEALDNMSSLQGLLNAFTRADAGLSQTQGEVLRQQLENFNSVTASPRTRAEILRKHILPNVEALRGAAIGSAAPDVVEAYRSRQKSVGGDADWLDALQLAPAARPGDKYIK